MATLSFLVLTPKNPAAIYMRFSRGRNLDIFVKTGLFINPDHWDKKRQRIRNLSQASDKDLINATLDKLSGYMLSRMNRDYIEGTLIDKAWVKKTLDDFFHQPEQESMYFLEYCEAYIEKAPLIVQKNKEKGLSTRTLIGYQSTLKKLKNFQIYKGIRLRFVDINFNFHKEFIEYLSKREGLNRSTIGFFINSIKVFARKAKLDGHRISEEVHHPNFFAPSSSSKNIYLNDEEINSIYQLELSASERLDNTRDNAIIGLRTGLRVSDFLQLDMSQIKGEYVEVKTKKTSHNVIIPLHPQVKAILRKRSGLPRNISSQNFNLFLKEVCQMAGIVEEVEGALMNPQTRRKEEGIFRKYQLVSSHTCRRSFATNLYGKLPSLSIMAITGHKTEKQFLEYIKITPREHAEKLKALWAATEKPEAE